MAKYILPLDQGTTSVPALIIDIKGQNGFGCAKRIYPIYSPTRMGRARFLRNWVVPSENAAEATSKKGNRAIKTLQYWSDPWGNDSRISDVGIALGFTFSYNSKGRYICARPGILKVKSAGNGIYINDFPRKKKVG